MKRQSVFPALCVVALLASRCGGGKSLAAPTPAESSRPILASPSVLNPNPNTMPTALFLDVDGGPVPPQKPSVTRSRWAKVNSGLLLNSEGNPRKLPANAEITLNLFPDTTYTGVIEEVEKDGGAYSWIGNLKGVEHSTLLIVYAAGLFVGHFASPGGVYEVSSKGGELYLIIQIDQSKLPGGEGSIGDPRV